jgi:4-hydroxy-2-oxoheptanedioate aldolase
MTSFLSEPADRSLIGFWLAMASATAAEVGAAAGFDWLLIDGEHGPNTIQTVLDQVRAATGYGTEVIVRPLNHDPGVIKQYLDIGIRTFLVPAVESSAEAAAIVAATRYPPQGVRGVASSMTRASGFGREPNYLATADDGICVLAQIESRTAVDQMKAIAATDGIDGLFVGPADLAASMGYAGKPTHPEVREAVSLVLDAATAAGKVSGLYAISGEDAKHWIDRSVGMVAVGSDIGLLATQARSLAASFNRPATSGGVR